MLSKPLVGPRLRCHSGILLRLSRGSDGWVAGDLSRNAVPYEPLSPQHIARSREIVSTVKWTFAAGMSSGIRYQAACAIIERMRERR